MNAFLKKEEKKRKTTLCVYFLTLSSCQESFPVTRAAQTELRFHLLLHSAQMRKLIITPLL